MRHRLVGAMFSRAPALSAFGNRRVEDKDNLNRIDALTHKEDNWVPNDGNPDATRYATASSRSYALGRLLRHTSVQVNV